VPETGSVVASPPPGRAPGALASATCGGVLYFLGYVGFGVWPCLLVFLVPFWSALERVRTTPAAIRAALVFGLVAYAGGFAWLWRLVEVFLEGNRVVGAVAWLAYGGWFAGGFVVYAIAFRRMRGRGWSCMVAGVAPLVALEWLQPHLFPVNAGSGLVRAPAWTIQAADLGGPLLLTALVGMANVTAFETWAWWRRRRERPLAVWAAALGIVLVVLGWGQRQERALATAVARAPGLRVGVVQANLGVLEKREQSLVTHERHLAQTRELLADGAVDLVVWPETAYVRGLRGPLPISGNPIREDIAVPLLFGGASVREEGGRLRTANAAFLIGADGTIRDAYEKNLLIPLAEYVPLASLVPALGRWFPHVEKFGASSEMPALRLGPWRIATPICYEVARQDFVRRMVLASRPHLLVTIANDAWFGDSQEPWIHLALARLRAVEHRRFLVRATNSGVSAIVDPTGRIVAHTGLLTRESLRGVVYPLEGETLYGRFGDWPGWLAVAIVAFGLTWPGMGRTWGALL
jgi:apolipoprotein N-acyltransferase